MRVLAMRLDGDDGTGRRRADRAPLAPEGERTVDRVIAGGGLPVPGRGDPGAVFLDADRTGPSHLERALAGGIAGHGPVGDHHLPLSGLVRLAVRERGRDGPPDLVHVAPAERCEVDVNVPGHVVRTAAR